MHCISIALAVAEYSAASTSLGRKHFSQFSALDFAKQQKCLFDTNAFYSSTTE